MHKTDASLLEKIEELTLYSIQLAKANRQQAIELKTVRQQQEHDRRELAAMKKLLQQLLANQANQH